MIKKILIANRGEIVKRIIRSVKALGMEPVVLWSDSDEGLDYLDLPLEKHHLMGNSLADTYLNADQILSVAKACGADALHPGYGFLSENAGFARQCAGSGITWIGPSPEVMRLMSGKESSRQQAIRAGVPVLEAYSGTPAELSERSGSFHWPVLVKAVSGGGGRGMRIIRNPGQFREEVEAASREAQLFFGDPRVFVEQYVEGAKHIEVQVIGDQYGNLVHLGERECTIQRRYQKLIEESPSPSLSEPQREHILNDAVALARQAGYDSAGTLEFLLAPDGRHYFMEMNTRIQVEHPVSEMVTGIDLIEWQIRVAAGEKLPVGQSGIVTSGHAIEARICAEDPASGFDPRPGTLSHFNYPTGNGIRVEHAVGQHFTVSSRFDSMIAKVIVHADSRNEARTKLQSALDALVVHGVETTREYLREVLRHPEFTNGRFDTGFVGTQTKSILAELDQKTARAPERVFEIACCTLLSQADNAVARSPWDTALNWRILSSKLLEYSGDTRRITPEPGNPVKDFSRVSSLHPDGSVWVTFDGFNWRLTEPARTREPQNRRQEDAPNGSDAESLIRAPLPGLLSRMLVGTGDPVQKGDTLAIIESMKTENRIMAGSAGRIANIRVSEGQQVRLNDLILEIEIN